MKRWKLLASELAMMSLSMGFAQSTLELVRERGTLNCGVNGNLPGFSYTNEEGRYRGFDVDFCNPDIRRFLGVEGDLWEQFALDTTVMQRVITQVGNYGKIYRRNLGPDTATAIPRGLNNLWTDDGLLYAPPMVR